jgi:hypothetical protein
MHLNAARLSTATAARYSVCNNFQADNSSVNWRPMMPSWRAMLLEFLARLGTQAAALRLNTVFPGFGLVVLTAALV